MAEKQITKRKDIANEITRKKNRNDMRKGKTTTLDPKVFTSKLPRLNHHTQRTNVTMQPND
jgi:hypothetical protein